MDVSSVLSLVDEHHDMALRFQRPLEPLERRGPPAAAPAQNDERVRTECGPRHIGGMSADVNLHVHRHAGCRNHALALAFLDRHFPAASAYPAARSGMCTGRGSISRTDAPEARESAAAARMAASVPRVVVKITFTSEVRTGDATNLRAGST